jgi:hypothetical protein
MEKGQQQNKLTKTNWNTLLILLIELNFGITCAQILQKKNTLAYNVQPKKMTSTNRKQPQTL